CNSAPDGRLDAVHVAPTLSRQHHISPQHGAWLPCKRFFTIVKIGTPFAMTRTVLVMTTKERLIMKQISIAVAMSCLALTSVAGAQSVSAAGEPEWTFSANLSAVSEYRYRDIMPTNAKPAVQGGIDIAQRSGFYMGNWHSSISWLSDADPEASSSVEMDF